MERETHKPEAQDKGALPQSPQRRSKQPRENPVHDLSHALGNRAMERLFASGTVQAKLRVSQPGDADENEADRAAEQVVSRQTTPRVQRKCACGGSCPKCQEEESAIRRSVPGPLNAVPVSLQRGTDVATAGGKAEHDSTTQSKEHSTTVIVEDEAGKLEPGQMRKSQFLALLESTACATADAVLGAVGHSTKGCPYIKKWLAHYREKSAAHLISAMHRYAPETRKARSAHEAIALLNQRVEQAALSWARTGKVSGMPEEVKAELGDGGFSGGGGLASDLRKHLMSFLGGGSAGKVQKKRQTDSSPETEPGNDAGAIQERLGGGQTLDGSVRSQMSAAFGYDFSSVRIHTDSSAAELSSKLNARAFTVGNDVAFAAGEYQPGTLIGDALIAHELAHVVQQGGGKQSGAPLAKEAGVTGDDALEQDADKSAVGAVVTTWTGLKGGLAMVGANALPRLKSGLKLQKCNCSKNSLVTSAPGWTVDELKKNLSDCDGGTGAGAGAARVSVGVGRSAIASGGSVDTTAGVITLDPGQDKCTATQVLVQEVTNYSHKADFERVTADAAAGNLSREEYIRQNERLEYDGVRRVIQAFDACKGTWGCTTCEKEWARPYATFDDYYNRALSTSHKEYYGQAWDRRFKAAYEAKHPPGHGAPAAGHH